MEITVNPLICPTLEPSVSIKSVSSFTISKYFWSYFLILSILSSNAFCTYSFVTILDFASFAQVAASPITSLIEVKCVEIFSLSPAILEAYSTILATASLSRSISSS